MSRFAILADATSNVNNNIKERFEIEEVIKASLVIDGKESHLVDSEFDVIEQDEFYKLIKKGKISTGAPSPERFQEAIEKYLVEGRDVLLITISSALSATYQYAKAAADELNSKYSNKVYVLDSHCYAGCELLLVMQASILRSQGKSLDEVASTLEHLKHCVHQAGPMDDLMHLARNGRISNGKAFMGTLVGINPIGEINREGLTKILCKVKGSKKALETTLQYMKKTIINPQDQIVVISNSNRKEKAALYEKMIKDEINPKEIISLDVGLYCAVNVGPGLCAAFYFGTEKSEGLVEEEKIIKEILGK